MPFCEAVLKAKRIAAGIEASDRASLNESVIYRTGLVVQVEQLLLSYG